MLSTRFKTAESNILAKLLELCYVVLIRKARHFDQDVLAAPHSARVHETQERFYRIGREVNDFEFGADLPNGP